MTGETGMSLADAGKRRQTVQTARRLAECSRKWRLRQESATAGCWQSVLQDVQLQSERRPQTANTWQACGCRVVNALNVISAVLYSIRSSRYCRTDTENERFVCEAI